MRLRVVLPLFFLSMIACSGRQVSKFNSKGRGSYYVVKPGETLWLIAQNNRITAQQIAEWNNIQDPDVVRAGMRLFIPKSRASRSHHKHYDEPLAFDRDRFQWPVRGSVISGFGMRDGNRHDGVDIRAAAGTPIHAAADGSVAYAGNLRGYGNIIIIRHDDRYYSTYAHNQRNVTKVGQAVRAGDVIAYVGSTGRASGPHLHFEVRVGATARNPLFFMPAENNAGTVIADSARPKFKKFVKRSADAKKTVDNKRRRR